MFTMSPLSRAAGLGLPALTLTALLFSSGCQGPCQELADKICECEPNANMEDSCKYNVDSFTSADPNDTEEELCERFLDTCSCDALNTENFGLCGLTRDSVLSEDDAS